jgi:hypothetical protein
MESTRTRFSSLVLAFGILLAPAAGIAGTPDAERHTSQAVLTTVDASGGVDSTQIVAPRINVRVPKSVRAKIESGFELAVDKIRNEPQCNALFAELGTDGIAMLSTTLYYKADLNMEKRVCHRAYGFTLVGGAPTWLCRQFSRLSDRRAAAVLLHEALHHAGLDEWPHDPDGLTPAAIDQMVEGACGF